MRQHLATLFASSMLAGCSFLYDTSDLPNIDAPPPDMPIDAPPPDMPIDADPSMLFVSGVTPSVIVEGQGARDGEGQALGSRPAVLLLEGANFVKDGTTVTVEPADPALHPTIVVDNDAIVVDITHTHLAVPVHIDVDPTIGTTPELIDLNIVVTQTVGGTFDRSLVGALKLQALPELAGPTSLANQQATYDYSHVDGSIDVATGPYPVRLHSWSSMNITGVTGLSASGTTPGPAGGRGGDGGAASSKGQPGAGPAPGDGGDPGTTGDAGGPGGWTGFISLPTLTDATDASNGCCRASGGGGGGGSTVLVAGLGQPGKPGGGSGGTLHLRADGDMTITNGIAATGAAGGSGSGSGGHGGDGAGGIVVLQAGNALSVSGAVNVASMGTGTGGDAAAIGKIRFDAASTGANSASGGYRGPAFVDPLTTPLITTTPRPPFTLVAGSLATVKYFIIGGGTSTPLESVSLGMAATQVTLEHDLYPGFNTVCLLVADTDDKNVETRNCIDLVYLTTAP